MSTEYRMPSIPLTIGTVILSFIAAALGSAVTLTGTGSWVHDRTRQTQVVSPPNYLFGPVWPALYLLIGVLLIGVPLAFVLARGFERRDVQIAAGVFLSSSP